VTARSPVPSALKIAHIDTGRQWRGGQEQLWLLLRGLRQRGHQQWVACPEGSPLAARAARQGLPVLPLPGGAGFDPRGLLRLRRQLRETSCDIVHAHDGHAQSISWLASAGLPVHRVASRLVAFPPRHPAIHRFKYTRTCHGVIAASESVRAVLAGVGVPAERVEVITAGVDLPPHLPDLETRARVRAEWGAAETDFVAGHAGGFTLEKGQDLALDALLALSVRLPRLRLVLAGEGPLSESPAFVEKLRRAGDRARLLGYVEDLPAFLVGLDLFLMPSRSEGWGLAALHAMAHGLAVVASRVGGLAEIVEDGVTGWLVEPNSAAALADAVAAAAADPQRLRRFGGNARERARGFAPERTVACTEAFYLRLLAGP